jgi:hypothetical protein
MLTATHGLFGSDTIVGGTGFKMATVTAKIYRK